MIRLLGFLIGSAASITLILVILGMPKFNLSEQLIDAEETEDALQAIEEELSNFDDNIIEELERIGDEVSNEVTDAAEELFAELPPVETPAETPDSSNDSAPSPEPETAALPTVPSPESMVDATIEDELKWHAFWTPFRSRIAAEGFVGRLEKVTGLDYRVIKTRTAAYEVAFGYEDDAERRDNMSLIASATGLDLPQT